MYINRTIKCLKRLQKRSIDNNLRQLVLIRQDRVLVNKVLASLHVILEWFFFFFYFSKNMGRSDDGSLSIRPSPLSLFRFHLSPFPQKRLILRLDDGKRDILWEWPNRY